MQNINREPPPDADPVERSVSRWECPKCVAKFDRLQIAWGECGGMKVDVLDYFCPHCPCNEPKFLGTPQELEAYWAMECVDEGEYAENGEPYRID